mmetsp:Transcript_2667/g.5563  ORF Transcript_2667/g.5563 Transcript_2667/m.5563 type:complete len:87 (+) Transcript_2667:40-300(+)
MDRHVSCLCDRKRACRKRDHPWKKGRKRQWRLLPGPARSQTGRFLHPAILPHRRQYRAASSSPPGKSSTTCCSATVAKIRTDRAFA